MTDSWIKAKALDAEQIHVFVESFSHVFDIDSYRFKDEKKSPTLSQILMPSKYSYGFLEDGMTQDEMEAEYIKCVERQRSYVGIFTISRLIEQDRGWRCPRFEMQDINVRVMAASLSDLMVYAYCALSRELPTVAKP
ncbi:hypothetical protein ACI2KR_31050 [Pseudomonas luteola]